MKQLDRYAQLKLEVAKLEEELELLKPEVVTYIQDQGAEQVTHDAGIFLLQTRRTYKYPEEVASLEAKLKEDKKTSEQLGTATYTEKVILVFKSNV